MKILYKILFEVQLLHEYYLTDPNQHSVFDPARYPTQQSRQDFLTGKARSGLPALSGDLRFEWPAALADRYKAQRLVLLSSYSGFQVAVEVTEEIIAGTVFYAPRMPMEDDFNIIVLLKQTGAFDRQTNGKISRPVPALYYFSNENLGAAKTPPVLSRPISGHVAGYAYEQGELYDQGGGNIAAYYSDGSDKLLAVKGNGFANENDRLIVGTRFEYDFTTTENVSKADFVLKDPGGNPVRDINISGAGPFGRVVVDLNNPVQLDPPPVPLVTLPKAKVSNAAVYTLEVSGDNGYAKTLPLLLYEDPADLDETWGIVQVQARVSNAAFCLLDTSGHINRPILPPPDGGTYPYPLFEIRCRSRYTFWRYYSDDPNKTLNPPTGALLNFLQPTGQPLTTSKPVPSMFLPFFFSTNPDATTPTFTYLPNPGEDEPVVPGGRQLFTDIMVPESALFPAT